jgi:hypothetical protein
MSTEEEVYMAKSLKFINSYKKNFTPVLSNIASNLNTDNELIEAMNNMKETIKENGTNSNLKELITVLLAYDVHSDEVIEYNTDDGIDHAAYVKQTLELMNIEGSKERNYNLLFMVMQDMKNNAKLMSLVQNFKQENIEWKKMVGMLIPKGARVKIRNDIRVIEGISKYSLSAINNKKTPISGTVVERGVVRGGEFLKLVSLPEDILRHKKYHKKEFKPEEIELYEQKAETSEKGALEEEQVPVVPALPETAHVASAPVALAPVAPSHVASALAPASGATTASEQTDEYIEGMHRVSGDPGSSNISDGMYDQQGNDPSVDHNDINVERVRGGQQRITRKHKNSIISSARKTRTNR